MHSEFSTLPTATSSGGSALSPGVAHAVNGDGGRVSVPTAGARLHEFPSVSHEEARRIFYEAHEHSRRQPVAEALITRLSATVLGLLAELDMRDELESARR